MKFVSLWINKDSNNHTLPPIIEMCLKSFVRHGHEFILFSYDKNIQVPYGITIADASMVMDLDEVMLNSTYINEQTGETYCSCANISDRFRWKILTMCPEYCWIDTDVYIIKHVPSMDKYLTKGNISVVKYNDSEFFKTLYDYATDPCIILPFDDEDRVKYKKEISNKFKRFSLRRMQFEWGYAGIDTAGKLMDHLDIESDDMNLFYPIPTHLFNKIFFDQFSQSDSISKIYPHSYGVHLWNGMINKFNNPLQCAENSPFHKMIEETEFYK